MNNKLYNIIYYAYNNSPYYKRKFDENGIDINEKIKIEDIPILEKKDIIEKNNEILSSINKNMERKNLKIFKTSGTTGISTNIYWQVEDIIKSNKLMWKFRIKEYNIYPKDKYCSLFNSNYNGNRFMELDKKIIINKNNMMFCSLYDDEESYKLYYENIILFSPKWLFIHKSFILKLIDYIKQNNLHVPNSIEYIELTGEPSTKKEIDFIKSIFMNCKIVDMYGMTEVNTIAYRKEEDLFFKINQDNVFIEVININNNIGELLVTSLTNYAFPLIRYRTNDFVELDSHNNIIRILGREQRSQTYFKEYIISYCVNRVNSIIGNNITFYKVIVESEMNITIKFFEKEKMFWKQEFETKLKEYLTKFYQNLKINFKYSNEINEFNKKGKYSIFE